MRRWIMLLLLPAITHAAAGYTAEKISVQGLEVIRLTDSAHDVVVSIAPSLGNRAFEMKVHGKNILYFPYSDVAAFRESGAKQFNGIPFLAPWANRMAGGGFWANGQWFRFNPDLGSVHLDSNNIAIHGMLTATPMWEVGSVEANADSAHATTRLPFWKYPELMANWPFAHEYEITYTLANGALQITTTIKNLSARPMPVSIGFHPYFNLPDVPRSEASVHIPARQHVEMDAHSVATGELKQSGMADDLVSLKDHTFDDGFTDLVRNNDGRAVFSLQAGLKKIEVVYGPRYQVAVVFAPPNKPFVCFEPMSALTNGVNLAHDGKYGELQTIAPGGTWQESFWVRSSGL